MVPAAAASSSRHPQLQQQQHAGRGGATVEMKQGEEQLSEAIIFSGYQPTENTIRNQHKHQKRLSGVIGFGLADGTTTNDVS